jgi:small nuclear ribonucleoprotein E
LNCPCPNFQNGFRTDLGACDKTSRREFFLALATSQPSNEARTYFQAIKMTGRGGGGGRRVLLPPINFLFRLLQQRTTVQIWLYEQLSIRIIGTIRGFDEFMNLVIDDAIEVKQITKTNDTETKRHLGQILLKGDNVSLIQSLSA